MLATESLLPNGPRTWFGAEFGLSAPSISRRPEPSSCSTSDIPASLLNAAERFGLKRPITTVVSSDAQARSDSFSASTDKRSSAVVSPHLAAFGFPSPAPANVSAPVPKSLTAAGFTSNSSQITPFGNNYTSAMYQLLIVSISNVDLQD